MVWKQPLPLNVAKMKEMVVDFRRTETKLTNTISILGKEVKVVEDYRHLGVHPDNKLDWKCKNEAVYRKGQNRCYFLFFASICWGSSIRASDTKKLNKLIKMAGSVLGTALERLDSVVERRMLHKLLNIIYIFKNLSSYLASICWRTLKMLEVFYPLQEDIILYIV